MMKKITIQLILILFGFNTIAQIPSLHWAKSFISISNPGSDAAYSVALDTAKNVYSTGEFESTMDFDPGNSTYTLTPNTSGNYDIFISKHDANGNFVWACGVGGSAGEGGSAISTDLAGNVYVAGYFSDTVDFDPGVGTYMLSAASSSVDIFVLKLDANGNFLWARSIGGTGSEEINSMKVTPSGNIYCYGTFQGTVDFDPGTAVNNLSSSGTIDVFILNLNTNGVFGWAKRIGNTSAEQPRSIQLDASGNIFFTGSYEFAMDADPDAGVFTLSPVFGRDVYMIKLDASGNFSWAQTIDAGMGNSIFPDINGNVLVCGGFTGILRFTPTYSVLAVGGMSSQEGFVAKYDSIGTFMWGHGIGSTAPGIDLARRVLADQNGDVYVSGIYAGTVDFDPGPSSYTISSVSSSPDMYILKLNTTGNFISVGSMGGTSTEEFYDMIIDENNNLYTTGYYSGVSDFDPGPGICNVPGGSIDIFINKMGPCVTATAPVSTTNLSNQTICSSKTTTLSATGAPTIYWYNASNPSVVIGSGGAFVTPTLATGTYTFLAQNSAACSSTNIATAITVTVIPSPTISVNSGSICAGHSFTIAPSGANTYTFSGGSSVVSPTANASYTVTGSSSNGCLSITSAVSSVTVNAIPTLTITPTNSICIGSSSTFSVTGSASTYSWSTGATTQSVSVTPTISTIYSVTGTGINNCVNTVGSSRVDLQACKLEYSIVSPK